MHFSFLHKNTKRVYKFFSKIEIKKVGDVKNIGKVFSKEEVEKYLDPFGFLDTNQYVNYQTKEIDLSNKVNNEDYQNELNEIDNISDPKIKADVKEKSMPKEYGFKYSGPEPTKFGDWNIKGKCTDF